MYNKTVTNLLKNIKSLIKRHINEKVIIYKGQQQENYTCMLKYSDGLERNIISLEAEQT